MAIAEWRQNCYSFSRMVPLVSIQSVAVIPTDIAQHSAYHELDSETRAQLWSSQIFILWPNLLHVLW